MKTKEEILKELIEKSNEAHNGEYDYALIDVYNGYDRDYPIVCHKKDKNGNEHGVFYKKFYYHIKYKRGCPECMKEEISRKYTKPSEKFVEEYNNDNIPYEIKDISEYTTMNGKITFICHKIDAYGNEHGEFTSTPSNIVRKGICPTCRNEKRTINKDDFYKRCKEIHGNKYIYDETIPFVGGKTMLRIWCPIHGWFEQTARGHISGYGCQKCANIAKAACHTDDNSSFLVKAKIEHGYNYEYLDEYAGNKIKIRIKCNRCGRIFMQTPNAHLQGSGCPYCKRSKLEERAGIILDRLSIKYTEWKTFDWLRKSKYKSQSLDYYLDDFNVAIECQGSQHFKPYGFKSSAQRFAEDMERDKRKFELCMNHGVKLFYINYWEDVEEKLMNILKEISAV